MQNVKGIAIVAAILLVLLLCGTTHILNTVAAGFSVASVIIFAIVAFVGVATRLRI